MISRLWFIFTIATFMWASSPAFAAVVKAVKDNQIILDMEGDNFKVGDILKIFDGSKQVGLAKIKAVKGNKAKAVIKGKAEVGFKLTLRSSGGSSHGGNMRSSMSSSNKRWGVMGGFDMASASATLALNGNTVAMSGTGFILKGVLDKEFFPWLNFRGLAGITSFDVSGPSNAGCNGSACNTSIMYLGADFLARYMVTHSIWVGAGVDLVFPLSKSATAIASSSISNTLLYDIAAGYDLHLGGSNNYIPIQLDYQMFPASSTVSAHMIGISAGYVFK